MRASTVCFSELLVEEAKRQVIKVGDGVRFRQQSDPAVRKGRVAGTDKDGVVIEGFDLASPLHDAKCMPPRCREGTIDLFHHLRNSLHDAVQAKFLFDQTDPQQIVVPIVHGMPHEAAAEIGFTGNREVGDFKVEVRAPGPLHEEKFVGLIRPFGLHLREDLGRAFGAIGDENFPLAGRSSIEERSNDIGAR